MGSDGVKVNRAGVEPPVTNLDLLTQDAGGKSGVSGLCYLFMAVPTAPPLGKHGNPPLKKILSKHFSCDSAIMSNDLMSQQILIPLSSPEVIMLHH